MEGICVSGIFVLAFQNDEAAWRSRATFHALAAASPEKFVAEQTFHRNGRQSLISHKDETRLGG
jgi:hypothetical protein